MDGKEPSQNNLGKNSKPEEFCLDETGFAFVRWGINFIESRGLLDQGLYRLVGVNSKVMKLTQIALENKGLMGSIDENEYELKTVTSAVKHFFRCLPEPLLTFRLHGAFIAAAKLENKALRINNIHILVHSLPVPNIHMLELLIGHLCKVAKLSHKNLMTISNLGVCFGPTLLRPEEETVAAIMEIKFGNVVVEILIENFVKIFKSTPEAEVIRHPPPYVSPPQPLRKDTHSPVSCHRSNRSSSADTFTIRNNAPSSPSLSAYSTPSYSSSFSNLPVEQKTRSGIMLYNPMWNNGTTSCAGNEPVNLRSLPPPRPPLPEQKNYAYPNTWKSDHKSHRSSGASVNLTSRDFYDEEPVPQTVCPTPNSSSQRNGSLFQSNGRKVKTLFACRGENDMELSFEPNEIIYNVVPSQEPGWIRGTLNGKTGLVPENYVKFLS